MDSCPLSHEYEQILLKAHFRNPYWNVHSHGWFQVDCIFTLKSNVKKIIYFISYDVMLKLVCAKKLYVIMY